MSAEEKARKIAERLAAKLGGSDMGSIMNPAAVPGAGSAPVVGDWGELQARLDGLYQEIKSGKATPRIDTQPAGAIFEPKPKAAAINTAHASMEQFGVNEAIVDEMVEFLEKEKACSFEPNGKPCDHCAMCSSRGF